MIQQVQSWLTGIACAALIAALADSLMPQGAVKQVGRLVCTLVLLWAALRPAADVTPDRLQKLIPGITGQRSEQQQQLEQHSNSILKTLIARESEAYIVDKAAELGVVCQAQVTCAVQEGGLWLPWTIRMEGEFSPAQQEQLSRQLASELDVPIQRQVYTQVDGGEQP